MTVPDKVEVWWDSGDGMVRLPTGDSVLPATCFAEPVYSGAIWRHRFLSNAPLLLLGLVVPVLLYAYLATGTGIGWLSAPAQGFGGTGLGRGLGGTGWVMVDPGTGGGVRVSALSTR